MFLTIYWIGILLAIVSGIINQIGTIMQKDIINQNLDNPKFMKSLIKSPKWVIGLIMKMIISGLFLYVIAQLFIGPALISGLMSSGLIVLAIGSVKILGERLQSREMLGIILNIVGILFLSFSGVSLNISTYNFFEFNFILRIIIFAVIFILIIFLIILLNKRLGDSGVLLALEAGLFYSYVTFWSSLISVSFGHLFNNSFQIIELSILIPSLALIGIFITLATVYSQRTLKYGKANILVPLTGVPAKISSFILGKRQTELEKI
ncbi:MAG: hypothetical protein P8Y97_01175 [Candidatus Lokiarchaeota archaeon]